jgi:chromosome partitioning protein
MGSLIAVGNLKGGTGKSTIALNLACVLAEPPARAVVLVDADPQGTASEWYAKGRLPITLTPLPLRRADETEAWLAELATLRAMVDHVVIDLPPQAGAGLAAALLLAELCLIPATPSWIDLQATGRAVELLRRARSRRGGALPGGVQVPSRVDPRTSLGRGLAPALARLGPRVGPPIRQRAAHIEAFEAGRWIGEQAPASPALLEFRVLRDRVLEAMAQATRQPVAA